uniref:Peptidyl-prolyl cis-trans isomerase n=1 Tax=Lygus hesperus TaxID=30085 RepID=A0A0A9X961_LYGHE
METLFDDENTLMPHLERGMVSIANCGKHTNSTQFFITFQKASYLDGLNVVCGKVTEDTLHILSILEGIGVPSDGFYTRNNRVVIADCGEIHGSITKQDKCNTGTLR